VEPFQEVCIGCNTDPKKIERHLPRYTAPRNVRDEVRFQITSKESSIPEMNLRMLARIRNLQGWETTEGRQKNLPDDTPVNQNI
jgi:hypothetical protein